MSSSKAPRIPFFKIRVEESGRILDIKENIVRIDGLPTCLSGEIVDLGDGIRGLVMEFDADSVLALVLGDESHLRMGKTVHGVSEPFTIPVGLGCVGRMLTALGAVCDEGEELACSHRTPVFFPTPSLIQRRPIDTFMPTGTRIVDALTPLGMGQRQLILGDRMTGKTSMGIDAVLSQDGTDRLCIYCCIGKSVSSAEKITGLLSEAGALSYTTVMLATDNAPVAEQYLLPFSAAAIGDFLARQGRDVLVVFDDLTKHAWAYRQISLLLDRPPGREAYPGDIFYVQTQLMEKAGCFSPDYGGGSMTFLGIAETLQGDMTGYIPSNLVSMCDGQVVLNAGLYGEGMRPPVDVSQSVSIVGGRSQPGVLRELSHALRADYAAYVEVLRLSRLSTGLSETATQTLTRGEILRVVFQQGHHEPASVADLVVLLFAVDRHILDNLTPEERSVFCAEVHHYTREHASLLYGRLHVEDRMTPELETELRDVLEACILTIRKRMAGTA